MESSAIIQFSARVRQLIFQYNKLKAENESLAQQLKENNTTIESLQRKLSDMQKEYDDLMSVRLLQVDDANLERTRQRISQMLRTINRCIVLLSSKE